MIYMYDILLNWTDRLRLNEFFEWNLDDDLEHIKKIPLIKVNDNLIKDLLISKIKFDKDILNKIKNKTEGYFHNDIDVIEYAVIFSNGVKAIAVELDDEGICLYKSSMLLDEEDEVLEMTSELVKNEIKYEVLKTNNKINTLTRKEEEIKNFLLKEIKKIKNSKEVSKANYLYKEFFQDDIDNFDDKISVIINEVSKDFNNFHKKLYNLLKLSMVNKNNV